MQHTVAHCNTLCNMCPNSTMSVSLSQSFLCLSVSLYSFFPHTHILNCTHAPMQHTAAHYNPLQHAATHWNNNATRCNSLQLTATHCNGGFAQPVDIYLHSLLGRLGLTTHCNKHCNMLQLTATSTAIYCNTGLAASLFGLVNICALLHTATHCYTL